ncbi:hypothetical protein [Rhizobium sp.]|jgi:hypothetical protein|uniref:hypothetical protein n=1 Tax=Rhizobium sp. TaxID=391 RepID=UPI002AA91DA2
MRVLKITDEDHPGGRFAALPDLNEFPNHFTSYALVQICQVEINGQVPQNVAGALGWQTPQDDIKTNTLQE